jgi:hypothetical protein
MIGAHPTRLGDASLQGLPRAKDSHGGVARREAFVLRERLDWRAPNLNRLERLRIFRLQRRRQSADTGADLVFQFRGGRLVRLEFTCEGLDRPVGGTTPAELIDGGVAKRSIKPRHYRFVAGRLLGPRHHFGKGILEDVFGQRAIADAAFEISQKRALVLDQNGNRGFLPGNAHLLNCTDRATDA